MKSSLNPGRAFFKIILFCMTLLLLSCQFNQSKKKIVIFCIGDGMGFEQIKAANYYLYGEEGQLAFESFDFQSEVTTRSADQAITDSAASATAMATGTKVNNGVISKQIPGDGSDLMTILEVAGNLGYVTGLVSTTVITHATPAAFASHSTSRSSYSEIFTDYMNQSRPDILLGGGGAAFGIDTSLALSQGYILIDEQDDLNISQNLSAPVAGFFSEEHLPYEYDGYGPEPYLSEMTSYALKYLDQDPDGFFLMVEGGRIDHACHANDLPRALEEMKEYSKTISLIKDWAEGRGDTLIIVTADHETGGLTVLSNNGAGFLPGVSWSTDYHTGVNVPYYIWGQDQELFQDISDNTGYYTPLLQYFSE